MANIDSPHPPEPLPRSSPQRPLHLIVLADCSGGMRGERMLAVNFGLAQMAAQLATWERGQAMVQVLIRAIAFPRTHWHIEHPVPVSQLRWPALQSAKGSVNYMAPAFQLAASVLGEDSPERPALLLITNRAPADTAADFEAGLAALAATRGGQRARRVAVGVGMNFDSRFARRFTGGPARTVLVASIIDEIPGTLTDAAGLITMPAAEYKQHEQADDQPAQLDVL